MKKSIIKYKNFILLTIGTFLVILSLCLLLYDKFLLLKSNIFDEIELVKYRENSTIDNKNTNDDIEKNLVVNDVETEEIDETNQKNEKVKQEAKNNTIKKEYIGYLEIKKINLKQGLVSKKSYYNHVDRNIQILSASDYPDKENGNVILAAHSGTGYISFFKNLYKLKNGDEAKIYYKGYIYTYSIVNIYNVPKVGKVEIKRDYSKSCLTLITCTKNSDTLQTVYILELNSKVKESGNNG